MWKDTPPPSPGIQNEMEEDELVYVEDADEIFEEFAQPNEEVEDMEELPEKDDAICVFKAHTGSIFCGSISKDGKFVATGGEDDKAYVWSTDTTETILECTRHKDSVIFAEFNHDDSYLATGDMSGFLQLWKLSDKTVSWTYNMGDATWLKWHPYANVLIGGSVEGEVYMWKVPEGDCKILQGYGHRAEIAVIMPDGKRIVIGYEDGAIRMTDLKTCNVLASILPGTGHSAAITALDCHVDNNLIISAAVDGKTILSTSQTGKIVAVLQDLGGNKGNPNLEAGASVEEKDSNWVEAAAFCKEPGLQMAATGTLNGEIFIWDTSKQALRHKIEQDSGMSKLIWKGTTSILYSAGLDGTLRCFNARSGQHVQSFLGHTADILDLYISLDGKRALTCSDDSTARIFDVSVY